MLLDRSCLGGRPAALSSLQSPQKSIVPRDQWPVHSTGMTGTGLYDSRARLGVGTMFAFPDPVYSRMGQGSSSGYPEKPSHSVLFFFFFF